MNENKEFKPYIPAEKVTPEFTITSIVMGILLAIVFGRDKRLPRITCWYDRFCIHPSRCNFHGCNSRYHAKKLHFGK